MARNAIEKDFEGTLTALDELALFVRLGHWRGLNMNIGQGGDYLTKLIDRTHTEALLLGDRRNNDGRILTNQNFTKRDKVGKATTHLMGLLWNINRSGI